MGFFRKKVLTFFVNESCNFKCIYCTLHSDRLSDEGKHRAKVIDLEFAKCGIDDYFGNGFFAQNEKKGIRIFGDGEPTLEFERIKDIVNYARLKAECELFVELQSNGSFPCEVADWIEDNVDLVWISLDGTAEIQNQQRPMVEGQPSFQCVDRNIQILTQSNKLQLGLRPTTTRYNVDRQKEIIDYAKRYNIAAVYTDPWAYYLGQIDGQPELMHFAKKFVETWKYAKNIGVYYGTVFTANFDEETDVYCRAVLGTPQFTPDGYVSTCDMVPNAEALLPQMFPQLLIGRYDSWEGRIHYNLDHVKKIQTRKLENLVECRSCIARKHCAGGCMGSGICFSGDFYGVNTEYCTITRYLFKEMQEIVNRRLDPGIPVHP